MLPVAIVGIVGMARWESVIYRDLLPVYPQLSIGDVLWQVRRSRKELDILREDVESREKRAATREARMQALDAEIATAHETALQ